MLTKGAMTATSPDPLGAFSSVSRTFCLTSCCSTTCGGSVSLALLPSPPWILSASSWGPGFGPGPVLSRSPGDAGPVALRPLGRRGHPRLSLSAIHTETLPPPRALCAVLLSLGPTLGEAAFPSSSPALPPARIPVPLPQYSRSCLCCSSCCWPSPDPEPSFTLMQ